MNPVTIQKSIEIEAPPSQVWSRVGTAAGLSAWWDANISMDEWEGGHFAESGHWNGRSYRQMGEVIIYDPPRRLLLKLRQLSGTMEWPVHMEIDIGLEEKIGSGEAIHTLVSITHRALNDEMDAIASEKFTPPCPNAENVFGPTMMLPQNVGGAGRSTGTEVVPAMQATGTAPFTLHDLYQWQYQQEARWEHYSTLLIALTS